MTEWLLVAMVVCSTAAADVLQSTEMKRGGPSSLRETSASFYRRPLLMASIGFMALSFFAFLRLLSVADLSFAVPATAASFVLETILARIILKERVDSRRWAGTMLVAGGVALLAV